MWIVKSGEWIFSLKRHSTFYVLLSRFRPFANKAQAKEAAPLAWATVSGMSFGP
jgi:hypothetical protein